ncbi:MAG: penicillin-binding protein [Patescibacteria group bacterium]|nr:MAG: penicillin-binding protein [Patescibacteria group bacterium]
MIVPRKVTHQHESNIIVRGKISLFFLYLLFAAVTARLFYWQILKNDDLSQKAEDQYTRSVTLTGNRGSIYTSDGYTLVSNEQVYTLFAQPHILTEPPESVTNKLLPLLLNELDDYVDASQSAIKEELAKTYKDQILQKLTKDARWVSIKANISEHTKQVIEELKIDGLGFDTHLRRYYPEASMAAHVTGFVGKDQQGQDIGYFGVEGALENELKARTAKNTILTDAFGLQLSGKNSTTEQLIDGRSITVTIRRDVQNLVESELQKAVELYGAKSGEVIVMEPSTGKILALAAYPNYAPREFYKFDPTTHKNPTLSDLYEPGSTLKTLTVSAGIEEGVITPETHCDICSGPRVYGKYTIRTWNNEYTPNITMEEGLAKSDNTAMIFIAEKLGIDKFQEYLRKFKIGDAIKIDLQEDRNTPFPSDWGDVKLATTSFGQGIVANSMQVLRAVNAIANEGEMMRPMIVESVKNTTTGEEILHEPVSEGRIISKETASTVTKMLVNAAQHGEAQWIASQQYPVAGKTGTSQVVTEKGYDDEKTIASFVGYAPPENPKFIMITKLVEPTLSPWAAETAAPLWHKIARKLYLLFNIAPIQSPTMPEDE